MSIKTKKAWRILRISLGNYIFSIIQFIILLMFNPSVAYILTLLLQYSTEVEGTPITVQCNIWLRSTPRNDIVLVHHLTSFTGL
jgi:hypothetical protein